MGLSAFEVGKALSSFPSIPIPVFPVVAHTTNRVNVTNLDEETGKGLWAMLKVTLEGITWVPVFALGPLQAHWDDKSGPISGVARHWSWTSLESGCVNSIFPG